MDKKNDNENLKRACHKFNIEVEKAKLIRSNKNLIYDCGDKILRISPSNIRSKTEIEAEISWLIFLAENKLPVVNVIQPSSKNSFEVIGNQDNYNTVVCFNKIVGDRISKPYWNNKHFKRLGKLTGILHRVGKQYKQKEHLVYKEWNSIIEFESYKYLPQDKRELPQLHQK